MYLKQEQCFICSQSGSYCFNLSNMLSLHLSGQGVPFLWGPLPTPHGPGGLSLMMISPIQWGGHVTQTEYDAPSKPCISPTVST